MYSCFLLFLYMSTLIELLQHKRLLWSCSEVSQQPSYKTLQGYAELDQALAEGFPDKGMIEVEAMTGSGELRLLLPYLKSLVTSGKLLVFIAPPAMVNANMLSAYGISPSLCLLLTPSGDEDALWCTEQCLRSGACASVLLWSSSLQLHQGKRLHYAAQQSGTLQVFLHSPNTQKLALPLPLRMGVASTPNGVNVTIQRQRRGWPGKMADVDMRIQWGLQTENLVVTNVIPFQRQRTSAG